MMKMMTTTIMRVMMIATTMLKEFVMMTKMK